MAKKKEAQTVAANDDIDAVLAMVGKAKEAGTDGPKEAPPAKQPKENRERRRAEDRPRKPEVPQQVKPLDQPGWIPPKENNWMEKLKRSTIWGLIWATPVLAFWYWQMANLMAAGPAQICMLVCVGIGAFKVGSICCRK